MKPSSSQTKPGLEEKPRRGQQRYVLTPFGQDNLKLWSQPHPSKSEGFRRKGLIQESLVAKNTNSPKSKTLTNMVEVLS